MKIRLSKLDIAVIKQLGYNPKTNVKDYMEELKGIRNASDGYNGFIYYSDTVKFYNKNKKEILQSLKDLSDDLGQNFLDTIKGFNCFKNSDITIDDIGEIVYGNKKSNPYYTIVANALSWYALEETAFRLQNEYDNI